MVKYVQTFSHSPVPQPNQMKIIIEIWTAGRFNSHIPSIISKHFVTHSGTMTQSGTFTLCSDLRSLKNTSLQLTPLHPVYTSSTLHPVYTPSTPHPVYIPSTLHPVYIPHTPRLHPIYTSLLYIPSSLRLHPLLVRHRLRGLVDLLRLKMCLSRGPGHLEETEVAVLRGLGLHDLVSAAREVCYISAGVLVLPGKCHISDRIVCLKRIYYVSKLHTIKIILYLRIQHSNMYCRNDIGDNIIYIYIYITIQPQEWQYF